MLNLLNTSILSVFFSITQLPQWPFPYSLIKKKTLVFEAGLVLLVLCRLKAPAKCVFSTAKRLPVEIHIHFPLNTSFQPPQTTKCTSSCMIKISLLTENASNIQTSIIPILHTYLPDLFNYSILNTLIAIFLSYNIITGLNFSHHFMINWIFFHYVLLLKRFIFCYVYLGCQERSEEGVSYLGTGVEDVCEPPSACWWPGQVL